MPSYILALKVSICNVITNGPRQTSVIITEHKDEMGNPLNAIYQTSTIIPKRCDLPGRSLWHTHRCLTSITSNELNRHRIIIINKSRRSRKTQSHSNFNPLTTFIRIDHIRATVILSRALPLFWSYSAFNHQYIQHHPIYSSHGDTKRNDNWSVYISQWLVTDPLLYLMVGDQSIIVPSSSVNNPFGRINSYSAMHRVTPAPSFKL
jgi:hypothetical protein